MKPFKIEGDKFQGASIETTMEFDPTEIGYSYIEIIFEREITPVQARKLAKWLMKAADYVEKENGR
jgi:hypothetical protein